MEFTGSILRIISNALVSNWSDCISKIIKSVGQGLFLNNKYNKTRFYIISIIYIILCLNITYLSKDFRCLVVIIPAIMEFYSLIGKTTRKYRWYIIITKFFWTINNLIFQLYVGIILDTIVVIGHFIKVTNKK